MDPLGISNYNGIFIRNPSVSDVGSDIEVLSKFNGRIVAIRKGNVIGTAFHPELSERYFIAQVFCQPE